MPIKVMRVTAICDHCGTVTPFKTPEQLAEMVDARYLHISPEGEVICKNCRKHLDRLGVVARLLWHLRHNVQTYIPILKENRHDH